ncbi:hypothetical protein llap_14965 [Limosa lapponica baueri]|uniref:Uncharacterized protein n=1 Tax=Limosa lapponica baueri TaxID=1758121 RepID=A0A2I0TLP1_LIMLA|nr:hypothetical protein llap_14965 [Limosa lapponica baueri]
MGDIRLLLPEGSAKDLSMTDHHQASNARRQQGTQPEQNSCLKNHKPRKELLRRKLSCPRSILPPNPGLSSPWSSQVARINPKPELQQHKSSGGSQTGVSAPSQLKGAAGENAGFAAPVALAGPVADIALPAKGRAFIPGCARQIAVPT